jgi:serine/threonine protein kinase/tetratricopeptide (TPR) repeat protein
MADDSNPTPLDEPVAQELASALADRYRIEKVIGRGGMATVYGAWDIKHDRRVAIKVLSPDLASAIGSERFVREIKTAARLSHPNILAVFDSGAVGDLLYYVMPFVQGESLRDKLDRESQLPVETAIEITCDVAGALGYAHAQQIVHRDIKPENILLQSGHVLVADFGIARGAERTDERLTGTGMSLGTAAYMAPEQAAGEKVDARADIYALGCTLYEMLAGHPPFTAANPMALMARHSLEPVPSIRIVRPAVPVELEGAIMRAMEKVPADRFQSMEDFKRAVLGEAVAAGTPTPRYTARYRTADSKPPRTTKRRIAELSLGVILVAAAAVGGKMLVDKYSHPALSVDPNANRFAVLYFDDGGNSGLRYFADGLTESLIDRLSAVRALDVISKDGVRPFRGAAVAPDSIGRALQVGRVVTGSVVPSGAKMRVTVHVADAVSGAEIGSKSFEVDTSQAMAAQNQLAGVMSDFLREKEGVKETLERDRAETTNDQAWLQLERAEKLRKDADSLFAAGATDIGLAAIARADTLLVSAAQLDPKWAKIPTRRATLMYLREKELAKQHAKEPQLLLAALDSGLAQANKALELQPNSADAYEIKGDLEFLRYQQRVDVDQFKIDRYLVQAESSLTRSVSLNKDQAGAWATLSALNYFSKVDVQAANAAALAAYNADAYLALANPVLKRLFQTYHDLEEFPEAQKWCVEGRRRFPTDPFFTFCGLAMYLTRYPKPNVDSAWIYRKKYISLVPEKTRSFSTRFADILTAGAIARAGLPDSARHMLLRARATPTEDPERDLEGDEAIVRVILGDQDEAVRLLADYLTANPAHRKGFATRTGWFWRDLQGNPKFKALLAGAR